MSVVLLRTALSSTLSTLLYSWIMPYAERIKVSLAAMDLQCTKETPGLSVADQIDAESDLVKGDIVFKICVVWDLAGFPSLS